MENKKSLKTIIFQKYVHEPNKNCETLRAEIIDFLMADIITIAKNYSNRLPENYETSDLIHAGVIGLLEQFPNLAADNQSEFFENIHLIVEKAIISELEFIIGPPKQEFIDNETALKLSKENQDKDKNKSENS